MTAPMQRRMNPMPDCESCGHDLQDPRDKNAAGWWRDRCLPCIRRESSTADEDRTPIHESTAYRNWLTNNT